MSFPLKNRNSFLSRRTLNAEPLEDRLLLTASGWGGFDPVPDINVYAVESSQIDVDFGGDTDFDQIAAADMNGDGINDIVTLRGADSAPVISVYLGTGGGAYAPARTFELPAAAGGAAAGLLADVTGDGVLEYIAASQNMSDGTYLDVSAYRYASGAWTSAGTSAVSLSVYGNYSVYAVTSIRLAAVGSDLAIQLENSYAFDSSGGAHSIDGLAVAAGDGSGRFSAARLVPAFTGQAVGSLAIGGTDYLVSLNSQTRTFGLWYYNSAKSAWSSAGSVGYAAELGNVAVTAAAGSGSDLFLTGTLSGGT
ncbi:MAG: VCBS repeat-containing protein, partial [Thermoguttaceae bacterium]|nr:VCBS repeat-containing protein [Thermoguttaceae bacterium]